MKDFVNEQSLEKIINKLSGLALFHEWRLIGLYDENNIIQQVEFFYEDSAKNQVISYENGRIKNVTQDGNLILTYTYESLAGGREATVITDITYGADKAVKKYYDFE